MSRRQAAVDGNQWSSRSTAACRGIALRVEEGVPVAVDYKDGGKEWSKTKVFGGMCVCGFGLKSFCGVLDRIGRLCFRSGVYVSANGRLWVVRGDGRASTRHG